MRGSCDERLGVGHRRCAGAWTGVEKNSCSVGKLGVSAVCSVGGCVSAVCGIGAMSRLLAASGAGCLGCVRCWELGVSGDYMRDVERGVSAIRVAAGSKWDIRSCQLRSSSKLRRGEQKLLDSR